MGRIYEAVRAASSGATLPACHEADLTFRQGRTAADRHTAMFHELLEKYREMRELRVLGAAGTDGDPRVRLRVLADRFPGALRELDRHPTEELDARIAALEAHLAGAAGVHAPPTWMIATYRLHRELRSRLRLKRWLAGRRTVDDALRERFEKEHASDPDLLRMRGALDEVARPPGQHLSRDALAAVASGLGVTDAEARRLVFGSTRPGT